MGRGRTEQDTDHDPDPDVGMVTRADEEGVS